MKLNFKTQDWDTLKAKVIELSQDALSVDQVNIGDVVRLVRFELDPKREAKCFDGPISLEMATNESWFFDKYSFLETDIKNGKFFYQNDNTIMFVLKTY